MAADDYGREDAAAAGRPIALSPKHAFSYHAACAILCQIEIIVMHGAWANQHEGIDEASAARLCRYYGSLAVIAVRKSMSRDDERLTGAAALR